MSGETRPQKHAEAKLARGRGVELRHAAIAIIDR